MNLFTNNLYLIVSPDSIDTKTGTGQVSVDFPEGNDFLLGFEDPEIGKQWIESRWKEGVADAPDPLYPLGLLPAHDKGQQVCLRYLLSRNKKTPFSHIRILTKKKEIVYITVEELKSAFEDVKEDEIKSLPLYQFEDKRSFFVDEPKNELREQFDQYLEDHFNIGNIDEIDSDIVALDIEMEDKDGK